ncbi:hypothetical protein F1559_000552 [Cyanidiococcus yangmingshanensis]|uniref:Uncharacterized protein n=1 Tax=Cyanidiococcus yangmingshanensis TaxID=2690220 RepID=A0A7J7IDS5_9RHOD|nr:hypothetical protein F1559_000552 [Cyanidiococcus yangmingshanensis]
MIASGKLVCGTSAGNLRDIFREIGEGSADGCARDARCVGVVLARTTLGRWHRLGASRETQPRPAMSLLLARTRFDADLVAVAMLRDMHTRDPSCSRFLDIIHDHMRWGITIPYLIVFVQTLMSMLFHCLACMDAHSGRVVVGRQSASMSLRVVVVGRRSAWVAGDAPASADQTFEDAT